MAKVTLKQRLQRSSRTRRSKPLRLLEIPGRVKKGSNEATKAIERGIAALVVIGADVRTRRDRHAPRPSCDEKKVPYILHQQAERYRCRQRSRCGLCCSSHVKPGKAKETIDDLAKQLAALKA